MNQIIDRLTVAKQRWEEISSLSANKIWYSWASKNIRTGVFNRNIANEAKFGSNRQRFEECLMEYGCYLEVKAGKPEIKGFDEESLMMFLLRWS